MFTLDQRSEMSLDFWKLCIRDKVGFKKTYIKGKHFGRGSLLTTRDVIRQDSLKIDQSWMKCVAFVL